jgi:hypothetical protein
MSEQFASISYDLAEASVASYNGAVELNVRDRDFDAIARGRDRITKMSLRRTK